MAKDQRNVLRLRRGRTVGLGLIVIMGFLLFGFVFLVDEPTQIVIVPDDPFTPEDEEIVIELPPIEDILDLEVPIPEFEPRTLSMTPIVTTTDDLGVSTTIRGETTFLSSLLGFDITLTGVEGQTFDDGRLKIELEFVTDKTTDEPILVSGELDVFSPATREVPEGLAVIQVCPPRCGNILVSTIQIGASGLTDAGIFVVGIYNDRIDSLVDPNLFDGSYLARFQLNKLNIGFDGQEFAMPTTEEEQVTQVTEPLVIYELGYTISGNQIEIDEQTIPMNATEATIEEVVTEDTPFVPCPLPVKADSISILFPSIGVSGTSALWDKITIDGKSHDIINVDIRNNRNCDLTLAVGSEWKRVTGEIFKSDIETFLVTTNSTQPFSSIPFDGTVDCNAGSCAGQEIQWCFIAKATVDDVTEIVDPFCGKKFYR